MYSKHVDNGYVVMVSNTNDGIIISQEEYSNIMAAINNRPPIKDGYIRMLKDNSLEWEFVKSRLDDRDMEATNDDYRIALEQIGAVE